MYNVHNVRHHIALSVCESVCVYVRPLVCPSDCTSVHPFVRFSINSLNQSSLTVLSTVCLSPSVSLVYFHLSSSFFPLSSLHSFLTSCVRVFLQCDCARDSSEKLTEVYFGGMLTVFNHTLNYSNPRWNEQSSRFWDIRECVLEFYSIIPNHLCSFLSRPKNSQNTRTYMYL